MAFDNYLDKRTNSYVLGLHQIVMHWAQCHVSLGKQVRRACSREELAPHEVNGMVGVEDPWPEEPSPGKLSTAVVQENIS